MRVGRNDPCPCGSGKKFKKCCLDKQRVEPPTTVAVGDPYALEKWDDFEDADGQMQDYDPLVEPDPDEWLAAGEQERIDAVKYYHRDARSEAERSTLHAVIHAVVENQIAEGDELPARRTMTRLMDQGLDRHEAIHAVGSVLAGHLNELMREAKAGRDPEGDVNVPYFAELERLTAKRLAELRLRICPREAVAGSHRYLPTSNHEKPVAGVALELFDQAVFPIEIGLHR